MTEKDKRLIEYLEKNIFINGSYCEDENRICLFCSGMDGYCNLFRIRIYKENPETFFIRNKQCKDMM